MKPFHRFVYQLARLWWKIGRPLTIGVRAILIQGNQVLLVKHTYQTSWYMPGGGVNRGESLEQAVCREAQEEVGATLGEIALFGAYSNFREGKNDHVIVFLCREFTLTGQTDGEIERFGFFPLDALPADTSPGTRRRIDEYVTGTLPCVGQW